MENDRDRDSYVMSYGNGPITYNEYDEKDDEDEDQVLAMKRMKRQT